MKRLVAVPLLAALAVIASCAREETASRTTAPAIRDDRPVDGGTLVRRLDADIATLNPVMATSRYDRLVVELLFTPLVNLDQNLQAIPGLAESWEISDDGLTFTFKLNPKATFSDGHPVRASDVVFTLGKVLDPQFDAVQIASGFAEVDMAHTRALDDHTLEVKLRTASAAQLIRFNDLNILPEHVYGKGDFKNDYISTAVGSGPYRLVRRLPGKEVVVEKRADYWGKKPYLQTVIFKVINDHTTAWNALRRGDIDETMMISDTWVHEHSRPEMQAKIDFRRFYSLNSNYIAWNNRNPLFTDKRVRRALAMCINLDSVVNDLYHGTARAMSGPFPPDNWAYNPTVPVVPFDPVTAKRTFASLGWLDTNGDGVLDKNGKPFKFDLVVFAGSATTLAFAQLFQAELKKIGVDMNVLILDASMAIQRILKGNFEAAYLGVDFDPDPDTTQMLHSSQVPPHGQNFVFYSNPAADRLMEAERREFDFSKRRDLFHQLHAILADDQPNTWVIQVSMKWGISKRVHGVKESRGNGLYLWYPGPLDWWIPTDQRTHDRPAQ